jgi:hypothetical protein
MDKAVHSRVFARRRKVVSDAISLGVLSGPVWL